MVKKLVLGLLLLLSAPAAVFAHDYWVEPSNFRPAAGDKIKAVISGGHSFPVSEFAVSDKLVTETVIALPSGQRLAYKTQEDKKEKCCISEEIGLTMTGIYLLQSQIKKPQEKLPLFYVKSILSIDDQPADSPVARENPVTPTEFNPISYTLGCLMEIIPLSDLTKLKKGDELLLYLLYGNKPMKETFEIAIKYPDKTDDQDKSKTAEEHFTLKTDKKGRAKLKITVSGRYLIVVEHKGEGCSLTFFVNLGEEKK